MTQGRRSDEQIQADLERLADALAEPRTMKYLRARFRVSRFTIYRWFGLLQEDGVDVRSAGLTRPAKYQIG